MMGVPGVPGMMPGVMPGAMPCTMPGMMPGVMPGAMPRLMPGMGGLQTLLAGPGQALGAPAAAQAPPPAREGPKIDPDVQDLCEHFQIHDERVAKKLSEAMESRQDTFDADMTKLWEVLESARS